ncbi:MAG TPA: hypothetical protein VMQ46_06060 [Acidimicrobiia bacterium]|nr:hypothetical protein [Acidimicrobiia bacterium]
MSASTRQIPPWVMPAGLAVLVSGLVAVALLRGPVELDPDTPEGTVQEYLLAIDEERWDDAVALIHQQWLGECDQVDLSRTNPGEFTAGLGFSNQAFGGGLVERGFDVIAEPDETGAPLPGSDASVEVTITHGGGGGLGSQWDEFVVFELIDEDGFWWISGDPWPYFVWGCRDI